MRGKVHPYLPNSVPDVKRSMCETIGISDVDELYEDIPQELRFRGDMNLPDPLPAEPDLRRHVNSILSKNCTCEENISFLGGGCARPLCACDM